MEHIFKADHFQTFLKDHALVLAYFSGKQCNVCNVLRPKLKAEMERSFPNMSLVEIPVEEGPELPVRYSVFTVPVVIFFVEGKEFFREARSMSLSDLSHKIQRVYRLFYT
ncbi:MAG TPA: thioredoxin family protein [Prolixibacteraceae bacterium]|nr:thioredoxin family protein [Prolixibacteraceae bacterium]